MKDPRVIWCWAPSRHTEEWFGPWNTREEAIEKGPIEGAAYGHEAPGFIAPAHWPDVGEIAKGAVWAPDFLGRMDEVAGDNEFYSGDDALLEYKTSELAKGAEAALEEAVAAWARKYVTAMAYTIDRDRIEPVVRTEPTA